MVIQKWSALRNFGVHALIRYAVSLLMVAHRRRRLGCLRGDQDLPALVVALVGDSALSTMSQCAGTAGRWALWFMMVVEGRRHSTG